MVATPIGNLEDMTPRGRRILEEVDVIACEDTRVAGALLRKIGIGKKVFVAVHHHSSERDIERIVALLEEGKSIAFVSDAGTPGVNDPGGKLAAAVQKAGFIVSPIPGPSALTAAISVCGFPMERFRYVGFIPHKKGRETLLRDISQEEDAVIFLESTHRIMKTLEELKRILSHERLVWVGRELTKLHETLYRGTIDEVAELLYAGSTKGEFIIVLAPLSFA